METTIPNRREINNTQSEYFVSEDGFAAGTGTVVSPTRRGREPAEKHYLSDEEILGIDPPLPKSGFGGFADESAGRAGALENSVDDALGDFQGDARVREENRNPQAEARATRMPAWMQAIASDPKNGGEAAALWREHQEFRAAFASPEEARAIKELLPGGVRDVLSLREATQSVERIDAAIFSGDARAQSEVVAEMARVNPAAFRAMFAEAAKVLAGMQADGREASSEAGGKRQETGRQEAGTFFRREEFRGDAQTSSLASANTNDFSPGANHQSQVTNHQSPVTSHQSPIASHQSPAAMETALRFDPAAYAAFERATNDVVARDVRGSINDTLARVMPEGVAEGAARRIGEDIFNEVHRALAADRNLSEQVASVLRDRRFGSGEQQRVASLLAGRAKQLVPSVARRVIGEWTGTVLSTARTKAARQAAAASRVDIAAPGGSLDSMPLRSRSAGSAREVNYASMSDEDILGM